MNQSTASGLRLLLALGIASQPAPGAAQAPDLRFERLSIDQGLSQSIKGFLGYLERDAEVHDGRVWVESEGVGRGSTFYFTISPVER